MENEQNMESVNKEYKEIAIFPKGFKFEKESEEIKDSIRSVPSTTIKDFKFIKKNIFMLFTIYLTTPYL